MRARESTKLLDVILPTHIFASEFHAQDPTPNWLRLENLEFDPGWGRWTLGRTAAVEFRVANPPQRDVRLDLDFANANLSKAHQQQRAILSLNGREIGTLLFRFPARGGRRTITIPARYVRRGLNVLRFDLPDAISPREIGINSDPRPLALYLHTLKLGGITKPF